MFGQLIEELRLVVEGKPAVIYVTDPKTGKKVPWEGPVNKGPTRWARGARGRKWPKMKGGRGKGTGRGSERHRVPRGEGVKLAKGDPAKAPEERRESIIREALRSLFEGRSKAQQYAGAARMAGANKRNARQMGKGWARSRKQPQAGPGMDVGRARGIAFGKGQPEPHLTAKDKLVLKRSK